MTAAHAWDWRPGATRLRLPGISLRGRFSPPSALSRTPSMIRCSGSFPAHARGGDGRPRQLL
jgi:hypothetical protein